MTSYFVRNSNLSPTASFLRELYKYPYSSNGSLSLSLGHSNLLLLKLIPFISKGQKHSILELPLQVLDLGIEGVNIQALYVNLIFKLVLALESSSYMLVTLGALLLAG
jgi:hypothetical protein